MIALRYVVILFESYVVPSGIEKLVYLIPAPRLPSPEEVLQVVDFSPVPTCTVAESFLPKEGDGGSYVVAELIATESRIGNVPDQAFNQVGRNRRGHVVPVFHHLVSQTLEDSSDGLKPTACGIVLYNAIAVV